jgi:hypothetical protein
MFHFIGRIVGHCRHIETSRDITKWRGWLILHFEVCDRKTNFDGTEMIINPRYTRSLYTLQY